MQPLGPFSSRSSDIDDDRALIELEAMLGRESDAAAKYPRVPAGRSRIRRSLWRVAPMAILVAVAAIVVLLPGGGKDSLTTGRSVAHSPVGH